MDCEQLKSLVIGYTALPELVQALDSKFNPRQLTSLLDREIKRKQESLRDLQAYRNFLAAPISVLPPEILADIFYMFASDSEGLFRMSWAKIMLVCQTWRRVGLSTPSLWSHLEFDGLSCYRRLATQLQRSKGWPLDVKARLYSDNHGYTYIALANDGLMPVDPGRLRSLDIYGDECATALFLEHLIPPVPTCPILRELKLLCTTTEGHKQDGMPLIRHLIAVTSPTLSVLSLRNMTPPWDDVRNLTSLEVNGKVSVECGTLLRSLARCPELRLLDVSLSTNEDAIPRGANRVPLLFLQSLHLHARTMTTCCHLLSQLTVPSGASIDMPNQMTLNDLRSSRVCSFLRRHFQADGARPINTLTLRAGTLPGAEWPVVNIDLFSYIRLERTIPDAFFSHHLDEMPYLSLCIAEATFNHIRQAFASILDALPVHRITHVNVGIGGTLSKKEWKTILPMLPALRAVTMRADATATSTIEALDWYMKTKKRRPVAYIRLDCMSLTQGRSEEGITRNLQLAKAAFRASKAHASRAKALGQPLDSIELFSGRFDNSAEQVLEGVAKKDVYRLLARGFIVDGHTYNKETTKEYYRDRRTYLRMAKIDETEWVPMSDSEAEAEISAEDNHSSVKDKVRDGEVDEVVLVGILPQRAL